MTMEQAIYLDHNATTPVRPEAVAAVAAALERTGNASSVHRHGRVVRRAIEDARERVAALIDAEADGIVFISGGTEANHLALAGAGRSRILASAIEHPSVLDAAPGVERIAVDENGRIDLDALEERLQVSGEPALVSVMLANNETGVLQPVSRVVEVARRYGAIVHCDAVQAAGKIPVSMRDLGVDMLTLSAHKFGGPAGVGALVVRPGMSLRAWLNGGGQERRRRAGTENAAGIAGFGAAAEAVRALPDADRLYRLRERLESAVRARFPRACIYGGAVERLPNTTCLSFSGLAGETQVMAMDLAGVSVSAGAACSSGKVSSSHVLQAMGADAEAAASAIRISLGWTTGASDVDRFVDAWTAFVRRALPAGGSAPGRPGEPRSSRLADEGTWDAVRDAHG